jgi:hypothetical protein
MFEARYANVKGVNSMTPHISFKVFQASMGGSHPSHPSLSSL